MHTYFSSLERHVELSWCWWSNAHAARDTAMCRHWGKHCTPCCQARVLVSRRQHPAVPRSTCAPYQTTQQFIHTLVWCSVCVASLAAHGLGQSSCRERQREAAKMAQQVLRAGRWTATRDAPVLDRPMPLRQLHDSGSGYKYPDLLTYLPFLRYWLLNNDVTLKSELVSFKVTENGIIQ